MAEQEGGCPALWPRYYLDGDKLCIKSISASDFYEDSAPAPLADTNPKTAYGKAKPPMQYVPPVAMLELGLVMEFGASKYGKMNWRKDPVSASTYYDALMRHAFLYWDGANYDLESKRSHLAHVMACCAILLDAEANGTLIDDRPEKGSAELHILQNTETFDAD
jgi:hypothetical protein